MTYKGTMGSIREVTTFAVVWIEIYTTVRLGRKAIVTTFAVVWIEIFGTVEKVNNYLSPPSRWCGLKLLLYETPK